MDNRHSAYHAHGKAPSSTMRRKPWRHDVAVSLFMTVASMALVACGDSKRAGERSAQSSPPATTLSEQANASDGSDQESVPATASASVQSQIREWLAQNELCQGSYDAPAIDVACRKSDHLRGQLERQGWCWAYDDWTVVRADYHWHRCSERSLARNERSVQREEFNATAASDDSGGAAPSADIPIGQINPNLSPARRRQLEDSRAAIRENWNVEGLAIRKIEFANSCHLIDPLHAAAAIHNVELAMQNELSNAGLLGDPSMSVPAFARKFIDAGKTAGRDGGCSDLTPAMRGHLRSMVYNLAQ